MSGSMPKPDASTLEAFDALVPEHPGVTTRPMFGQRAAFVNANMFLGVFGRDIMMRLAEPDRDAILSEGGLPFEPMGRPMREYVLIPRAWLEELDLARPWVERSLAFAEAMPAKQPKSGTKKA